MAIVTVVGAGMMGSALTVPLVDAGHEVRLVGTPLDDFIIEALERGDAHPKLGLALPASVSVFPVAELDRAMTGAEVIGLGVSSAGIEWASGAIAPHVRADRPILMISKGLELVGGRVLTLPEVLTQRLPGRVRAEARPVAVAGPCIAGELARRVETCVVFTGADAGTLRRVAGLARTPYYHVFQDADVVGVEIAAALKNAYAMGIAFAAGLHERSGGAAGSVAMHNYEAAVFAQAAVEMRRIARALGSSGESVLGLAGVGDLTVTCNGGRTGRFGRLLGLGLDVPAAIEAMDGATLECLEILAVMRDALPGLCASGALGPGDTPLLEQLIAVALEQRSIDMPFARFFSGGVD